MIWHILLLCIAFIGNGARADDRRVSNDTSTDKPPLAYVPAVHFNGLYEFTCNGIPFGKLGISIDHTIDQYAISSDIATTGLLKIFVPHKSHTTVIAEGADFHFPDAVYESRYQTRKKKKSVKMVYTNGLPLETKIPPDNPAKRPPPSKAQKQGAPDPLTFILRHRHMLADAYNNGNARFDLKYYDGSRLTLLTSAIEGWHPIRYNGAPQNTLRIALSRTLIAGFSQSEREDYSTDEPRIYVYFSNDGRLLPLMFEVHVWFGTLRAELIRECDVSSECLFSENK
jgi:hypothetical protein